MSEQEGVLCVGILVKDISQEKNSYYGVSIWKEREEDLDPSEHMMTAEVEEHLEGVSKHEVFRRMHHYAVDFALKSAYLIAEGPLP